MKFKTLSGKLKDVNINRFKIDWDGDSLSDFQANCKDFLYPFWKNYIVCEEFRIPSTRMSLDMFCVDRRVAIECQGRQHSQYVPFLSGSRSGYLGQIKRDLAKEKWCELNKINLCEIHPDDLPKLSKEWFKKTYDIDL